MDETWSVIVFDTETTGIDVQNDRIVEISIQSGTSDDGPCWTQRINPGIPIPPEATATHGISDADVASCPPFAAVASLVRKRLSEAQVVIGYNSRRFDIPLVAAELERAGEKAVDFLGKQIIDVLCLWQNCEPRTLSNAHLRFAGKPLDGAHGAEHDTRGTGRVLSGMIRDFKLENTWEALAKKSATNSIGLSNHFQWQDGVAVFGFGKFRGQPLHLIAFQEPDYIDYILKKDFPRHVLDICGEVVRRRCVAAFDLDHFNAWLVETYGPPPRDD